MLTLQSQHMEGVMEVRLHDLFPWTIHHTANHGLFDEIAKDGMRHPLVVVRMTGMDWYRHTTFGRKAWKLPILESMHRLPDKDAAEVLTVRVGNQRWRIALDAGYDAVSCLVFDSVANALEEWERIRCA